MCVYNAHVALCSLSRVCSLSMYLHICIRMIIYIYIYIYIRLSFCLFLSLYILTCEHILNVYALPRVFHGFARLSHTIRHGFVSFAIRVCCWGNYIFRIFHISTLFYCLGSSAGVIFHLTQHSFLIEPRKRFWAQLETSAV